MKDRILYRITTADIQGLKMPLIVVYAGPRDYPGKYVARLWDVNKPTDKVVLANSLAELRASIPTKSMIRIPRFINDDPCIVEVWL